MHGIRNKEYNNRLVSRESKRNEPVIFVTGFLPAFLKEHVTRYD